MAKNRVLYISYFDTGERRFLTIGRQAGHKVYCGPTAASLRRLCHFVNPRADRHQMSIHLWIDGWTACCLDGSV